jgi:hypothetical protein
MNTEALARQYGKPVQEQNAEVEYLFTLDGVEALLAAEREACAKVCESFIPKYERFDDQRVAGNKSRAIAAAIRSRT